MDWSRANNVITARSDDRFDPQASSSRVEIASALYQYMNLSKGNEMSAPVPAPDPDAGQGSKVLIAYFSATNNTKNIVNHLEEILNTDLYEVTPEQPCTAADLNYNSDCHANDEQNDPSARPAISGSNGIGSSATKTSIASPAMLHGWTASGSAAARPAPRWSPG